MSRQHVHHFTQRRVNLPASIMPRMSSLARATVLCFCSAILYTSSLVVAVNPIIQTRYTADPAPMVWNNTVYIFSDHDEPGALTGFNMTDWRLYSTTDMVNYVDLGSPLALADFSWASYDAWAPQTIERNGKFYMYVAAGQKNGNKAVGVAVSDKIEGPYKDPLGKPLVATSTGNIDPTVYIDDDGQAYLYTGNPTLYYVKLNEDMISYHGGVQNVSLTTEGFGFRPNFLYNPQKPTTFEEGPWFYKRNGLYYLMYAADCCPEDIRYSTSHSPTGPWKYQGVIMAEQGGCSGNHAGVIDYKGNSYFFYHNQGVAGGGQYDRSICVEQFTYQPNDLFPTIKMTYTGAPQIGTLDPYQRVEAETMANSYGVETQPCSQGTQNLNAIEDGYWLMVQGVDFGSHASKWTASVASDTQGGRIELRLGSVTGKLIGSLTVTNTGGWQSWKTMSTSVRGATGVQNLFLVFRGEPGYLFNVDYWSFSK